MSNVAKLASSALTEGNGIFRLAPPGGNHFFAGFSALSPSCRGCEAQRIFTGELASPIRAFWHRVGARHRRTAGGVGGEWRSDRGFVLSR